MIIKLPVWMREIGERPCDMRVQNALIPPTHWVSSHFFVQRWVNLSVLLQGECDTQNNVALCRACWSIPWERCKKFGEARAVGFVQSRFEGRIRSLLILYYWQGRQQSRLQKQTNVGNVWTKALKPTLEPTTMFKLRWILKIELKAVTYTTGMFVVSNVWSHFHADARSTCCTE